MTAAAATERRLLPWRRPGGPGGVPPARTILRWLYLGRLSIVVGVFLAAALSWWKADLTQLLIASVSVTAALAFTAASVWWTHILGREPGATFLYGQALFDLALVTSIVHISGPFTYFAALYILLIAVNAVLMPFENGMLIALAAGIAYAADTLIGHPEEELVPLLLQVGVYWVVAVATGYLASRVRVMGQATEALSAELLRVRLEAGDILRNIRTGILTVGGDGRLVYANPTAESLLGLAGLHVGSPLLDHLDRVAPVVAAAIRGTTGEGRRIIRREGQALVDGRSYPLGVSTTAVAAAEGAPPSVTAIFKDISDEKRLEAMHLRTERLEAIAEIAASLAHEIKNPLASIRSAVEMLARTAPPGDDGKVLATLVLRESDRLSRLLSEFMDFTRVRVTRSEALDLVAVAEAGIRLARQHPDCPADAEVTLVAPVRPVPVEGDEDLLHRVVFNLVLNAVQAAGGPARVVVGVATAEQASLPPGVSVEEPRLFWVRDHGPGVAPEVLPRLFEPFVTGRAGGTGLGLAIVQRAVQAHKGVILCDSVPREGTTFTIYIPARSSVGEAV